MSDQTMKILQMLEDGKITVEEANRLISAVQDLEEQEAEPDTRRQRHSHPGPQIPHIGSIPPMPPMPDVGKIVNDALSGAFRGLHIHPGPGSEEGGPAGTVVFQGARFKGARLEHTDLTGAKLDENTRLEGADMRYAAFVDADLRGADLRGAVMCYSAFVDTKFRDADLRGANLSYGSYVGADFRSADLHGADLSYSDLSNADFRDTNEPGLNLRGVAMRGIKYQAASPEDVASPESAEAPAHAATDANDVEQNIDNAAEEHEAQPRHDEN